MVLDSSIYPNYHLFLTALETPSSVFRQREPTETKRLITQPQQLPKRPVLTTHNLSTRSEFARSIREASDIATDAGDAAGTEELREFTTEIEQSMQKLIQLQSKAAVGLSLLIGK